MPDLEQKLAAQITSDEEALKQTNFIWEHIEHQSLDLLEVNMLLVHLTAATSFHCSDLLTTKFILFSKRLQHTTQGCQCSAEGKNKKEKRHHAANVENLHV